MAIGKLPGGKNESTKSEMGRLPSIDNLPLNKSWECRHAGGGASQSPKAAKPVKKKFAVVCPIEVKGVKFSRRQSKCRE